MTAAVTLLPDALKRVLLSKVSELDALFEDSEIRASVAAFAPSYVLVAVPKSSSTYSTQVLAKILGASVDQDLVTQDRCTPKDLSVTGIINARDRPTISQLHLTATGANLRILRHFQIPIVLLMRNIFDVVTSLRDHMNISPYFSSVLIPNAYGALGESEKLDYVIDTAVPWMITLYTSWVQAQGRGEVDTEFVFYEDMVREPVPFFSKICARFGRPATVADIERSLAQVEKSKATRFNVGKPGRGMAELSEDQVAKIRRHAIHYPGIDFSPLGL
jgi:hypothetical protein